MHNKNDSILVELRQHAPFTMFGAFTGIICMLIFKNVSHEVNHTLFYIFHPGHVVLSAMVTAAVFRAHTTGTKNFIKILIIGYVGSIGVATLSDSIIPYLGEYILGMQAHVHVGFIESWYIVNPAALIGVLLAYCYPKTHFPHAGHVLLSTWASSFHMIMAINPDQGLTLFLLAGCLVFLFLAVWLPCCVSDIVFPLLIVKTEKNKKVENAGK